MLKKPIIHVLSEVMKRMTVDSYCFIISNAAIFMSYYVLNYTLHEIVLLCHANFGQLFVIAHVLSLTRLNLSTSCGGRCLN